MIEINLSATGAEQIILKDYLQSNASEVLADKINNGVKIEKDGKTLINKKDFTTFMNYACDEAKRQAAKGAKFACIDHNTVFGWLIHYFEENSIEGALYNEDGSEYKQKPAAKTVATKSAISPVPAPKPKPQMTFFDFPVDTATETMEPCIADSALEAEDDTVSDELQDATEDNEQEELSDLIQISDNKFIDEDGVIHEKPEQTKNDMSGVFSKLFDSTLKVRCEL